MCVAGWADSERGSQKTLKICLLVRLREALPGASARLGWVVVVVVIVAIKHESLGRRDGLITPGSGRIRNSARH